MPRVFDTLLLLALPASGKSETRNYLTKRNPDQFHMGPTVQLDDYPYVHMQVLVDKALARLGMPQAYHRADSPTEENGPFMDVRELHGLIVLLNQDYAELRAGHVNVPENAGEAMLARFDDASAAAGAPRKFDDIAPDLRAKLAAAIDAEARALCEERAAACPKSLDGYTIVIEFARGGPEGDSMPLPPLLGYKANLPYLSDELLAKAAILYIRVDPAESRRKNRARARPDGAGSILFHGTPESVMMAEYARCDMPWLVETAPVPGTVRVEAHSGTTFDVPIAMFDNRQDLTTFLREEDDTKWAPEDVRKIHSSLKAACDGLWDTWSRGR